VKPLKMFDLISANFDSRLRVKKQSHHIGPFRQIPIDNNRNVLIGFKGSSDKVRDPSDLNILSKNQYYTLLIKNQYGTLLIKI
jgi:hypothetical protein